MKSEVLSEKLKEGLKITERIINKSFSLPILNNILIKTEQNFLNLQATDLEIGIRWWILAKTEKEGSAIIPPYILSNFLNFLSNKKVLLDKKENYLNISCENYNIQLKTLDPEEFPIIPSVKDSNSIVINVNSLCEGLSQVVNFTASSSTTPEVSGVYFSIQKDFITITATDKFRLGERKIFSDQYELINIISAASNHCSFIIPQKTVKEILNIFGEKSDIGNKLTIYFSQNQVMFESLFEEFSHPKIQLVSRLIEGEYPNYQEVVPKKYDTQIILPKEELLNQVKTASFFSGKTSEIRFKINPKEQKMEISSQHPDIGNYHTFLTAKIKGQPTEVSFNHRFLIEGLSKIKGPEIVFELNSDISPSVLKSTEDQSYIYVIMPIKSN